MTMTGKQCRTSYGDGENNFEQNETAKRTRTSSSTCGNEGGGKRDMQKAMTNMMHLRHDDDSVTTMPADIGALATRYCR